MSVAPRPARAHDAVVVGGGHNGLVAAAYLSAAGLRVCVLERRPVLGGACVTEELWPGRRIPRGAYVESFLQHKVVRDLDLHRFGYQPIPVDPGYCTMAANGTPLFFHRDPAATSASLARHSRRDAARHPEFQNLVRRLVRALRPLLLRQPLRLGGWRGDDLLAILVAGAQTAQLSRRDRHELARMVTGSVGDVVDAWFVSEAVRGAWASTGVIGAWAGPRTPGTAYNLLMHAVGEINRLDGLWGHVRGGMGAISQAIAASARAQGADIRVSAPVQSIDIADGRVVGVTLADGSGVRAPIVLSNAHPRTTLLDLAGRGHFPSEVVSDLERYRSRGGSVKINCVLSEPPRWQGVGEEDAAKLSRTGVALCPSVDFLERAWQDAAHGKPSDAPHLEMQVPSMVDDSLTDDSSLVMTVFAQFGPPEAAAWGEGTREAYAQRCLAQIARFAPNVPGSIMEMEVLAPPDLEEVFGLVDGSIMHGEPALDQVGSLRPSPALAQYSTPVHGLYLCGAGTHPGGGVTGAPGHNAARRVLADRRRGALRRRLRRSLR